MWLHHKIHFVHPSGCGHTLYTVRVRNYYESLVSFICCLLTTFQHWHICKLTIMTMWLHHKKHFVHPQGCGHILYALRIRNYHKSFANFNSCLLANFHWSRSKESLKTIWLHHKMQMLHPLGCRYTLPDPFLQSLVFLILLLFHSWIKLKKKNSLNLNLKYTILTFMSVAA
jgi:hypothetical protein